MSGENVHVNDVEEARAQARERTLRADEELMFPVLMSGREWRRYPECPHRIPWRVLRPREHNARQNHGLTLSKLAKRGGLSPLEIEAICLGFRLEPILPKDWDREMERAVKLMEFLADL